MAKVKEQPRQGKESSSEDRISRLPDDVLVSILSQLTVREAMMTSVLSTRWRHLCYNITRINFDNVRPTQNKNVGKFLKKNVPRRCVKWIHRFLDTHKRDLIIDEFRVKIPNISSLGANIDKWLKFAFSRGVGVLEIDLSLRAGVYSYGRRHEIIHHSFSVEKALINHKGPMLLGFKTVKSLSLNLVDVDNRGVELLISNCDVLESLSIRDSRELNNVIVAGHKTLKHLDIRGEAIKLIDIRNLINLVSFRYHHTGPEMFDLIAENVPKLIEIDSGGSREAAFQFLDKISQSLDQLVQVSLAIHSSSWIWIFDLVNLDVIRPPILPKLMNNVKRLVVEAGMNYRICIFDLISLVHESPLLQELHVQFGYNMSAINYTKPPIFYIPHRGLNWEQEPHHNLITVKFSGYEGTKSQFEFASYILKNALKLEKLIIVKPPRRRHDVTFVTALARAWHQFRGTIPAWHQFRGTIPDQPILLTCP